MSRPRLVKGTVLDTMVARRTQGASFAAIASEFATKESTARRAVQRELARRHLDDVRQTPVTVECPAACRSLLFAEAKSLGMRPAALAAELIDLVLRGGLVAAVRDVG